ncbi:MAG TPA: phosphoribosylanthranilate isomerase [Bacteroidetes bacterium]|nr:phosphoribosylanthranilate isomerase [Bacteroidota bacterium]
MHPRIKICCISSAQEAEMAVKYGAHALGLVAKMPSGPGPVPDALIADIARATAPPTATFLLTSETRPEDILKHHLRTRTNTIQIVDAVPGGTYKYLRQYIPAIKLVQVIHVINEASIDEALRLSEKADALLLDSGNPNLKIKILGGTGNTHNWALSKKITEQSKVPVFLAGGLNADNVRAAIEQVQPFGLDLCSGVRTDGHLDEKKLEAFFRAAQG